MNIFLSKSVCFAQEMLRAALRRDSGISPDAPWIQVNIGVVDKTKESREITMTVIISPSTQVFAQCWVSQEGDRWNSGVVQFTLPDDTMSTEHRFRCRLDENGGLNLKPEPVQRFAKEP